MCKFIPNEMTKRGLAVDEMVVMLDSDVEFDSESECDPVDAVSTFLDINIKAEPSNTSAILTKVNAGPSGASTSTNATNHGINMTQIIPDSWKSGPFVPIVYDFDDSAPEINPSINLTENSSILDFFLHFMNYELIFNITNYTNTYCRHLKQTQKFPEKSRIHKWQDTTPDEMYIFYAVSMLMTRNSHLTVEEHWSTDPLMKSPAFGQTMSRDRYEIILKMLHYCDVEKPVYGDRLFKIRVLVDHCRYIFRNMMMPNKSLRIDENIAFFKGRLLFKQYVPSKHHKFGIKMFVLCDVSTGYILDFIIYCGDGTEKMNDSQFGISGAVVSTLLKDYFAKRHTLWRDNWYSSPDLFEYIYTHCTEESRTVKSDPENMPKFKKTKTADTESLNKGPLLAIKWHDRREVHMLTTLHIDVIIPTDKTNKTTNGPANKPQANVVEYNKNMGSVDKSDMMLSSLSCMRKSKKWYKKVGLHIIDLFLLNAYYSYLFVTKNKIGLAEFQLCVIRQLVDKFSLEKTVRTSKNPSKLVTIKEEILKHMPKAIPLEENSKRPIYRRCKMCYESQKRKSTRIICVTCEVALCDDPCFFEYHKKKKY